VESHDQRWPDGAMRTVLLLGVSNLFMTVAWYWHLRGGMAKPVVLVILIS
jgi:uncharacterized protein